MKVRIAVTAKCVVTFVAGCAPTETAVVPRSIVTNSRQRYMQPLHRYLLRTKEALAMMMDASARTGKTEVNCRLEEAKVLGTYERAALNDEKKKKRANPTTTFRFTHLALDSIFNVKKIGVSYHVRGP